MNELPAASIIVPTLNEEKYLPALLASLQKIPSPLDIIVVDGNSTDKTQEVVERFAPSFTEPSSLRFIQANQRGISLQRNMGAAIAKHNILVFCDADVVFPSSESYQNIVSEFTKKKYVVAAPLMTSLEPGLHFDLIYCTLRFFQRILLFLKRPYFPGAYLLTTKEAFLDMRGFDPQIRLGEDVDYSLRTSRLGPYGLINVPVKTSSRRLIKYGYLWVFKEIPRILRFVITGKVTTPERMFYPFGDF